MSAATTQTATATHQGPDPQKWLTPECRLSYPYLFQPDPKPDESGRLKYKCSLIFPKTTDFTDAKKAVMAAAIKFFGEQKARELIREKKLRMPFRDGKDKADKPGYGADTIFLNVSCVERPGIVDQAVQPVLDSTTVYPGMFVRASLRAFGYDNKGNKGVAFGLNNLQLVRDGESLGGRSRPGDDFTPLAGAASQAHDDIDDLLGNGGGDPTGGIDDINF